MSDILLGALIGLGGAVLGSIIMGVISYVISKLQINARRDELNQQLTYNEKQAQINRLIELRKPVLIRLKEVVSRWMQTSVEAQQMTVRLKAAYSKKDNPEERARESKLWKESGDKSAQISSELAVLQGQLSDSTLAQMIENVIETYWVISQELTKLQLILTNPKDLDSNSLLSVIKEYRSIQNKLRGYLLNVNKRIDDLLSGEPSN